MEAERLRALKILNKRPAHELQERPLEILTELVGLGYARRQPYISHHRGKRWPSYETTITEAGRAALQAA